MCLLACHSFLEFVSILIFRRIYVHLYRKVLMMLLWRRLPGSILNGTFCNCLHWLPSHNKWMGFLCVFAKDTLASRASIHSYVYDLWTKLINYIDRNCRQKKKTNKKNEFKLFFLTNNNEVKIKYRKTQSHENKECSPVQVDQAYALSNSMLLYNLLQMIKVKWKLNLK